MEVENMSTEEQKQVLIDTYINLLRIKSAETGENKELNIQIAVTKTKLSSFSIDTAELEKMFD